MTYTPTFNPSDIASVSTDIVVGTGVEMLPFAPLIGLGIVLKSGKETGLLSDFGLKPKKSNVKSFIRMKNNKNTIRSKNFTIFD